MNGVFRIVFSLILMLSISSAVVCADEKSVDTGKAAWQELLSDVVGHYPLPSEATSNDIAAEKGKLSIPKNWEVSAGIQRFMASHTSYEIGEPSGAFTKPLSRLKFPVNTWWWMFDLRRTSPRWSIGGQAGFSANRNSNGWMEDSDWTTTSSGFNMLTNYSRSYTDIRKAFLFRGDVDVNVSDRLRLPPALEIKPLFAFQYQRFSAVSHDGVQWNYDSDTSQALKGNCISFNQDWYLYMLGLRGSYKFDINKNVTVKLKGEADWGPAIGWNSDHHIQRSGNLWGYIHSSGSAMYFLTGVDMVIKKTITIGMDVNYLWIRTSGRIHDVNEPEDRDLWWSDGVKAYSDQLALKAHVSYAF